MSQGKAYDWGNWGKNLRRVDGQLSRYPGHKECGRKYGKNVRFHWESDRRTMGRRARWRKAE